LAPPLVFLGTSDALYLYRAEEEGQLRSSSVIETLVPIGLDEVEWSAEDILTYAEDLDLAEEAGSLLPASRVCIRLSSRS
jgi:hypothetical protein